MEPNLDNLLGEEKLKSILIVDDQFGIRIMLNEMLTKEGYKTFQAANGKQALEILEKQDIDLILLDFKIPGMDGIEIFRRAIANGYTKQVITISAYSDPEDIQNAKKLGAKLHFRKPIDREDLREAIGKLLPSGDEAGTPPQNKRDGVTGVIDRFVGDIAVIKMNGIISNFPKDILPDRAKVGDLVTIKVSL